MVKVLFDTNIFIDHFSRHMAATRELATYDDAIISSIMTRAGLIRGKGLQTKPKIGLPDCIIRATAEAQGRIIVTRNPKDFGGEGPQVRVPYDLDPATKAVVNIRAPLF